MPPDIEYEVIEAFPPLQLEGIPASANEGVYQFTQEISDGQQGNIP
jgi:hypothetical protein